MFSGRSAPELLLFEHVGIRVRQIGVQIRTRQQLRPVLQPRRFGIEQSSKVMTCSGFQPQSLRRRQFHHQRQRRGQEDFLDLLKVFTASCAHGVPVVEGADDREGAIIGFTLAGIFAAENSLIARDRTIMLRGVLARASQPPP